MGLRSLVPIPLLIVACSVDSSALTSDSAPSSDSAAPDSSVLDSEAPDSGRGDSSPMDSSSPDGDAAAPDGMVDGAMDAVADTAEPGDATMDAPSTCTTGAPAANVMVALPAPPSITLDGDLSEWGWARFASVTPSRWRDRAGPAVTSDTDLSARAAVLWTSTDLYVAVEVTDDTHFNASTGWYIWEGDSIQVAFDMADDGGTPYDDTDDFEYGWALTTMGTERFRWVAPTGAAAPADAVAIVRGSGTTVYEARLSAAALEVSSFAASDRFGFAWIVNEMDAAGSSQGFLEWMSGIGYTKDPSLFGDLVLRDCD